MHLVRALIGEPERVDEHGGVVFCCQAAYILLPGSFFSTYSTNSAIADLTLSTADAYLVVGGL